MTHGIPGRTAVRSAVSRPRPVDDPALRLFLFHHAGGSHLVYRGWAQHFPADWDVCLLDAPGRGMLHGEPCQETVEGLVEYFADELRPWLDRPFALFGHSMGALVAHELTGHLAARGRPAPVWLGLSGWGAPDPARRRRRPDRHLLSDDQLREYLASLGGMPRELMEQDGLWRMFAPVFRSDFRLVDTWDPDPAAAPLAVPLSVFGGDRDPVAGPDRLAAWSAEARVHLFPGDHFYLGEHRAELVRQIVTDLTDVQRRELG